MGKCKYCGEASGWFRYRHTACEDAFVQAQADFVRVLEGGAYTAETGAELKAIAAAGRLPEAWVKTTAVGGLRAALDKALDDGLLSEEEQERMEAVREGLGLDADAAEVWPYREKLFLAQSLRMLLLYLFKNVQFHEERTRTHYEGRSSGVSIRIAKGVYYRTGGFRGNPVQETNMEHIDTGYFAVTDKHFYFHGPSKSFRTRYDRIVGLDPYSDGVGVRKDGTTARPQVFSGMDGWYVFNVIRHFSP
jgi:hypothetical protein